MHRNFAISDALLRPKFSILGRISGPNFQIEDVGRFVVPKKCRIPVFHRSYFMGISASPRKLPLAASQAFFYLAAASVKGSLRLLRTLDVLLAASVERLIDAGSGEA
ncbi:MAG: hypothetical protein IJU76_10080 [Desulfovibrionaceae bacterium]|nr:hypothetical protein [Desulfovibrionaceae bacterium]